MTEQHPTPDHEEDEFKSKSQLKREMQELQDIARQIVGLSQNQINQMELDSELLEAVALAKKLERKREALRRHMQFMGKLMRNRDVAPIQQRLERILQPHIQDTRVFHQLEQWRDELLGGDNDKAHELCQQHPALELQKLRQLIRQANREAQQNKPPKSARALFQYLKDNTQG